MSRSYKHSPVCNVVSLPSGVKEAMNRKFRRTVPSEEEVPSGCAYKRYGNTAEYDRWYNYETKNEFVNNFQLENGRHPTDTEVWEQWGQWNRNK